MELIVISVGLITAVVSQEEDELYDPWADNCEAMDPGDNSSLPEKGPSPYHLHLAKTSIRADQGVYLTLASTGTSTFQGFMVQGRDKTGEAVGEFDTPYSDVKVINCFARPDNTATHSNTTDKKQVRLRWSPDTENEASVTFFFTVARQVVPLREYWVCQKSNTLHVSKPVKPLS